MDAMKKKKLISRLISWGIALVLIGGFAFVLYKVYTVPKGGDYGEPAVIKNFDESVAPGKYVMKSKDNKTVFEMDAQTTYFTLTRESDDGSKTVWYSNPLNWKKDSQANSSNKNVLASTLLITYIKNVDGDNGTPKEEEWNNYKYSIEGHNYEIHPLNDGSIRVDYTIGNIERDYVFPTAISVERFDEFTGKMGKAEKKFVKNLYSKKDPEAIKKSDAKNGTDEYGKLLAQFPTLENGTLYVLQYALLTPEEVSAKAATIVANKADLEKEFTSSAVGYTKDDLEIDNANLVPKEKTATGALFNISVVYSLDRDNGDLIVSIPYDRIRCGLNDPLIAVSVLPNFGAADLNTEGFILVPEGSGAIIRYNNGKIKQPIYETNVYGMDYAKICDEAKTENRTALPVFGMSRETGEGGEGNSFICIIESGDSLASIRGDISGKVSDYNVAYAKYNVINFDDFHIEGRKSDTVYMAVDTIPDVTTVQRYRFVDAPDYVSMAASCREYIVDKYDEINEPEAGNPVVSEDVPVNVELVGAINKKVLKAGMPIDSVVQTTTFDEADRIIDDLVSNGIKNLNIRMTGWSNGGVRQSVLTSVDTISKLGGDRGMENLITAASKKGVGLYFDGITCFAYDSDVFDGFVPFTHAARFASREQVKLYPFDIITFKQADWMDKFYLVRPDFAKDCASNLIKDLKSHNAAGVAFRDIGRLLSGDYYYRNFVTREEVKQMNIETLREAADAGLKVAVKAGNLYVVPYVDLINDMDLAGNSYAILDESVPFYPIVLHGLKDYTGESVNMAGDYESAILKCAEYGSGLNFTFMKTDPIVLQDSPYSCYTSAGYDRWKDLLFGNGEEEGIIRKYQNTMAGLNQKMIIGHQRLSRETTVTYFGDGNEEDITTCTGIFVNAGSCDFEYLTENGESVMVPARSYLRVDGMGVPEDATENFVEEEFSEDNEFFNEGRDEE